MPASYKLQQKYREDIIARPLRDEDMIDRAVPPDKNKRRIETADLTWTALTNYVQHNYLEDWILRMSKYFNKFIKIGDDFWDKNDEDENGNFET